MSRCRAFVFEEAYGLIARVAECDEGGETIPKFDRLVYAHDLAARVENCGREAKVFVDQSERVAVFVPLGDATDEEFTSTAGLLIEAAS